LSGLGAEEPNYIKPNGVHKRLDSEHIMDVLVLKVIPDFLDSVLDSFHSKLGGGYIRMDEDIEQFYKKVMSREELQPMLRTLKQKLIKLQVEYISFYNKRGRDRDRVREEVMLSPRKKIKRSFSDMDQSERTSLSTKYAEIAVTADALETIADMDSLSPGTISYADKIKAVMAYCLSIESKDRVPYEPNGFVWNCGGFRALCEIKCNAVMSRSPKNVPPRISTEQLYVSLKASTAFARAEIREIAPRENVDDDDGLIF